MPTFWNTVGKVKNIKLHNFCLVRLFHSLHSKWPSLWKSHGYVATPYFFHVVPYERLPAKHPQQTYSCLWHLLIIYHCWKCFANGSRLARMAVLSVSAACRTNCNHMTSCRVQSFPWIRIQISPTQALTTLRVKRLAVGQLWLWAASALPLSHNSRVTTNPHNPLYVLHRRYRMTQPHTWQPLSMCRQNSVRGRQENSFHQERSRAECFSHSKCSEHFASRWK